MPVEGEGEAREHDPCHAVASGWANIALVKALRQTTRSATVLE